MRVSYANSTENILKALDRFGDFLVSRKAPHAAASRKEVIPPVA
jgi:hypothetical protein